MGQMVLFGDGEASPPALTKKKKKPSAGWEVTAHACRHCCGRVLRRVNPNGAVVCRCADCGASVVGDHDALCWCGVEVRGHGAIFECFENPNKSMAAPQEVLVREKKLIRVPEREPARVSNKVNIEGFY